MDNAKVKRKGTEMQTMIHKTLQRKLQIERRTPLKNKKISKDHG